MAKTYTDYVSGFPSGVNSGVEPLLIGKGQLSMAVNVSLRGGFAKTRAAILKQSLIYSDPLLQTLVETGYFQGAGYYRPDYGTESLLAVISGHIIQFTPSGTSWTVSDISIPGDLLSATAYQVWMWQSERWMIISDGSGSLPIFFDGVSCRRSYGPSVLLGNVIATSPAAPPAISGIVTVTLSAAYNGPLYVPIIFNKEFYEISQPPGTPNAVLTNVNGISGNGVLAGTNVLVTQGIIGTTSGASSSSVHPLGAPYCTLAVTGPGGSIALTIKHQSFRETYSLQIIGSLSNVAAGDSITVNTSKGNMSFIVHGVAANVVTIYNDSVSDFTHSDSFFINCSAVPSPAPPSTGTVANGTTVLYSSNHSPNVILGTIVSPFTIPAIGSTVNVVLNVAYSGTANQAASVGGFSFTISPASPAGGISLTLINLSDASTANYTLPQPIYSVPEIPACRMGAYGMARNWFSLTDGISYGAGDIVGGAAGTQANNYRDSVLKTTENDFLSSGGTFRLPGTGDIITSLIFPPILDTSLGQGQLQIGTAFSMFSNNSPVDRADWKALTSPLQTESLKDKGPLGQNSTIIVNSDVFFRASEGIASLVLARRDFTQANAWGNKPISNELQRILKLDNKSLLPYGSAVSFDNRYLCTCSPNVIGQGVFHGGLTSLNFDLLSSLRGSLPPAWEGAFSGINVLQLVSGRVNGSSRFFAFTFNLNTSKIQLHEMLSEADADAQGVFEDDNSIPITWFFETAVLFNQDIKPMMDNVRLDNGEISLSNIRGEVSVKVKYRPLFYPCWVDWHSFTVCSDQSAQNSQPQYRYRLGLGTPDGTKCEPTTNLPFREGLAFQFRVEITGYCTFQDLKVQAVDIPNPKYPPMVCDSTEAVLAKCQALTCVNTPDLRVYNTQGLPPLPPPPPGPPIPTPYGNDVVYFNNLCSSGTPSFSGQLPSWITLDAGGNRLVGAAGTFRGATVAGANAAAQSDLNQFVVDNLGNGNLTCGCSFNPALAAHTYGLTGYTDGDLTPPFPGAPGVPVWAGDFITYQHGGAYGDEWMGPNNGGAGVFVSGRNATEVDLVLGFECLANVPTWHILISDFLGNQFGEWTKSGGADPIGLYIYVPGSGIGNVVTQPNLTVTQLT